MIAFGILLRLTETQLFIGYTLTALYFGLIIYAGIKLSSKVGKGDLDYPIRNSLLAKSGKRNYGIANGYDVILSCLDSLYEETPKKPAPCQGPEQIPSGSQKSPTEKEVISTDQTSANS